MLDTKDKTPSTVVKEIMELFEGICSFTKEGEIYAKLGLSSSKWKNAVSALTNTGIGIIMLVNIYKRYAEHKDDATKCAIMHLSMLFLISFADRVGTPAHQLF